MLVLPGAMALACLSANWLKTADVELFGVWYFYKTYHAHLDTAFIVGLAFGSAFALDLLRVKERAYQVTAWSYIALYLLLLIGELQYICHWYLD